MKTQTTLKAVLLLTVLAMLTACGAQKSYNDTSTITDLASHNTASNSASNAVLLRCNQKSQDGITAKMTVYTDAANQLRNDYIKLQFTQMPSSFTTGDYIQLFRWQANSANQVYLDPVALESRFETTDGRVLTNFSTLIYWGQIASIAKDSGITNMNTFLQNIRLVVNIRDPQGSFDVLKIAMYNSNSENTVNMDMLIPSFSASPDDYAIDQGAARASHLQALHPFAAYKGQNWTATQYQSMGNSFCF